MRKITSLNKDWKFEKVENHSIRDTYISTTGREIDVPHTWNLEPNDGARGEYLYQKELNISEEYKESEIYLEFLGANSICKVYLNNDYIGEHRGGYSTFRFDITSFYKWNDENILRVFVDNSKTTDVSPLNGDFTIYGGLYRPVNLICVNKNHFSLDYWGTDGVLIRSQVDNNDSGTIDLELHTSSTPDVMTHIDIFDKDNRIVNQIKFPSTEKEKRLTIDEVTLWNGQSNPYLYTLRASLVRNDEVLDEISKTFGFRSTRLTADQGFYLNDKHLPINGVAQHQDFAGVGNAINENHMHKNFELIEEIGANSLRLSHYQHDQRVYDLCDQKGYVVWAEIPMMSMPDSEGVLENAENQLKELVLQNMHHPSICFWGIQNEIAMDGESIAMYRGVESLNELARDLLPHEITASANMYHVENNSPLNFITDMVGYNLYFGWYYDEINGLDEWIEKFHEENPAVPLGISEYGADSNLAFHSDDPKVKDYSEEFQALYHEKTYQIIQSKEYMWGSFVWNMFDFGSNIRDEGGTKGRNNKGLVSFDRAIRKDAFYFYKATWSSDPFVHLCEKRFVNREKEKIDLKVYSNMNEVTLEVNHAAFKSVKGESVFHFKDVPLQEGINHIKVYSNGFEDSATFVKVNKADESYIFVDSNPEINVRNWFSQEKGEVDLFPEGYYSILDTLGDLMENKEAWEIVTEFSPQIVERSVPGAPVTLLWVANKLKNIYSEEDIKEVNKKLIKVKKK